MRHGEKGFTQKSLIDIGIVSKGLCFESGGVKRNISNISNKINGK